MFNVFHLKEDKNQWKQGARTIMSNLKDRGKQFYYKIIPKTKLKYSMYSGIKKMIGKSSSHQHDKPDLAGEWRNRR